jgi:hypothetical protein
MPQPRFDWQRAAGHCFVVCLSFIASDDRPGAQQRRSPPFRGAAEELIAKLISGGYLQPALRDNPAAVTTSIVRLKDDLRGRHGHRGSRAGRKKPPIAGQTTPKTRSQLKPPISAPQTQTFRPRLIETSLRLATQRSISSIDWRRGRGWRILRSATTWMPNLPSTHFESQGWELKSLGHWTEAKSDGVADSDCPQPSTK